MPDFAAFGGGELEHQPELDRPRAIERLENPPTRLRRDTLLMDADFTRSTRGVGIFYCPLSAQQESIQHERSIIHARRILLGREDFARPS
jgi:hypothetical protein